MKKKLVVFTGAGISAESGIKTFRDTGGMWEEYDVEDVATPEAWEKNMDLLLEFYNQRRKQVLEASPNEAHLALVKLEELFDVSIITQNVDNLHERAGSSKVLHLHGELFKSRSTLDENLVYDIVGWELKKGEQCAKGSQLRPHIVWFGEMVPNMDLATEITSKADLFLVIGTSLAVYPAALLVSHAPEKIRKFIIDPQYMNVDRYQNMTFIKEKASAGMTRLADILKEMA